MIRRRSEEENGSTEGEEESQGIADTLNNLSIETGGLEEEAAEGLEAALGMEVDGGGKNDRGGEGEGEGDGTIRALGYLEFLTQDVEPSGTALVDALNGFNKMIRLAMLWTVRHCCLAGARFAFNCYRHWAQLLLLQPGEPPVTILSREGGTQGDPYGWYYTGSPSSPFPRSSVWWIWGFSRQSVQMMRHLTVRHE